MRIAVTGAAGYLGVNLLLRLVAEGHEVTAIDRVRSDRAPRDGVTWVEADILDRDSLPALLAGHEIVYHLVAMITLRQEDEVAWRVNTEGVRNVAEAALEAGVRRLVHCSSVHSFDQHGCTGILDETSARSEDPSIPVYDRSKWAGEQELRKVIDKGLDAVICNPTGIYGPPDHGAKLSRLNGILADAARGRVPAAVTGGFDLVDVRDVAKGLTLAAEKGRTGENYLLAGQLVTILEACRIAARCTRRRGPLLAFPIGLVNAVMPLAEPIGRKLGSDVVSRAALSALLAAPYVEGRKAYEELGFVPRPAIDTIRDLVAHLVHTERL